MIYTPSKSKSQMQFLTLDEFDGDPPPVVVSRYEDGFLYFELEATEVTCAIGDISSFFKGATDRQARSLETQLLGIFRGHLSDDIGVPGDGYFQHHPIFARTQEIVLSEDKTTMQAVLQLGLNYQFSNIVRRSGQPKKVIKGGPRATASYNYQDIKALSLKFLDDLERPWGSFAVSNREIIGKIEADFESVSLESRESLGVHFFKVGEFARKPRFVGEDIVTDNGLGKVYAVKTKDLPSEATLEKYDVTLTDSQLDAAQMTDVGIVDDERLHDDQLRALNAHLSTEYGVVNAMATGEGKTISTLIAANHRSELVEGPYRMLVVVEASVREQWLREAQEWLNDDFIVTSLNSRKDVDDLKDTLDSDNPVVILCSYTLLSRVEDPQAEFDRVMAETHFHDAVLDEGRTVRGSNKTARSLWHIRRNSDVGLVLCATPVLKNVQDMSSLMAWARNTPGIKNATVKEFFQKMQTKKEFERWYAWWGTALVRSSGSSKKMSNMNPPDIQSHVDMVTPSLQELELSRAISGRIRDSLTNIIDTYKKMGNTLSQEDERHLRGQLLATSSISRQAASDPRMLKVSETAIAELLQNDGTLNFKDDFVPAKINRTVELCKEMIRGSEPGPVVIFTEFKYTAGSLKEALEAEGIKSSTFIGNMARTTRDQNLQDFNNGKVKVLIATSAAERGLNLQVARHMIHFDHKFTPDSIFQRTGRLTRINSQWKTVNIWFLVTKGTIDEKVFSIAVARSGLAGASATHSIKEFASSERGKMISNLTRYAHREAMNRASESGLLSLTEALVS